MSKIPFINYNELDEFSTIPQVASLFGISKKELKEKCEQHRVKPRRNEIGEWGFVKYDVRKLHNILYHESRENRYDDSYQKEDDPWA